jgi:DNA repair exonuclease SbcCD nuclease subunit
MKFVFYTDSQLSGMTPRHRTDDYQDALASKIEEVYKTAQAEGADFLVNGGDMFNSHRIYSYELLSRVMDAVCDSGLDTWVIIGQHDLTGYNRETYTSSTLAFVANRCNRFQVLWETQKIGDVVLHSSHVWEDPMAASRYVLDPNKFNVLVSHHLLTNKKTIFDVVNTGEYHDKLKAAGVEFDLVLSGDLHDGYDVHQHGKTWFCNPGSMARQASSDAKRMPQFAIVECEVGQIPTIDVRQFQCARPGDEVFGQSLAEVAREAVTFDPTAFIDEISSFEAESSDVHELIQKTGKVKGIRSEVLGYLARKSAIMREAEAPR